MLEPWITLLERAMREGDARALYEFILDLECLKLSSLLDVEHSSHPHLVSRYLNSKYFRKSSFC